MTKKREDKEFINNQYKPFTAKNEKQKELFNHLNTSTITIAHGAAGTGKTACAVSVACELIYTKKVQYIMVTRPAVEAGEKLGSLPGELEEKFAPWMAPVISIMGEILGKSYVRALVKDQRIIGVPLGYMRGHTYNDTCMILDEAQNTTPAQMKMFLTRIGWGSRIMITGDTNQSDISGRNGLTDAIHKLSWMSSVSAIEFNRNDVVRHSIISDILSSYDN